MHPRLTPEKRLQIAALLAIVPKLSQAAVAVAAGVSRKTVNIIAGELKEKRANPTDESRPETAVDPTAAA